MLKIQRLKLYRNFINEIKFVLLIHCQSALTYNRFGAHKCMELLLVKFHTNKKKNN